MAVTGSAVHKNHLGSIPRF